jgi:LPPG:FO 2-phospho-L-lactate transferase
MMAELGLPVDAAAAAQHYGDILDCYVADEADAGAVGDLGVPVVLAHTLMLSLEDREGLARAVLEAAGRGF